MGLHRIHEHALEDAATYSPSPASSIRLPGQRIKAQAGYSGLHSDSEQRKWTASKVANRHAVDVLEEGEEGKTSAAAYKL